MSNHLAIATVTATLKRILQEEVGGDVPGAKVTTLRPDRLENGAQDPGLNIYLYLVGPNAAWRNADLPSRNPDGGLMQRPQAALDLHYLITAYGDEGHLYPQRLLGSAVRVLHSRPLLTREVIRKVVGGPPEGADLGASDLAEQPELVKLTPVPMGLEELHNLWFGFFQAPYFLSVVYQASVVLIEGKDSARSPLPVLTRTVIAQPGLEPSYPTLQEVIPPNRQPAVRMGDVLTLTGHHLEGEEVRARFTHDRSSDTWELEAMSGNTSTGFEVQIPDATDDWQVGVYRVAGVIRRTGQQERVTNELPIALAPHIVEIEPDPKGDEMTLHIETRPKVRKGQRVTLLIDDRELAAEPIDTDKTDTLTFKFKADLCAKGEHWVRLRVTGVDSLLVDSSGPVPAFDESQKVEIP